MDDPIHILELLLAGGVALLVREFVAALKARGESQRADQREDVEAADRLSNVAARLTERFEDRLLKLEEENRIFGERVAVLQGENSVLLDRLNQSDRRYAELGARLQGEIALRTHLQKENEELRLRVRSLEQEVAILRSKLGEQQSISDGPEPA